MEPIEIIRRVSIVLMWFATGLNVLGLVKSFRLHKKQKEALKELDSLAELYEGAIKLYQEAAQAYIEWWEEVRKEASDESV